MNRSRTIPATLCLLIFIFPFFYTTAQEIPSLELLPALQKSIVEKTGITQGPLFDAAGTVRRHLYVPEEKQDTAYEDRTIPLGRGLFIPAPSDIFALLDFSGVAPADRVLLIGNSTEYTGAVIKSITQDLTLLEYKPEDAAPFLPFPAVLKDQPLFTLILIQASLKRIPDEVFGRLAENGRLAACLHGGAGFSILFLYTRTAMGGSIRTGNEVYYPEFNEWD